MKVICPICGRKGSMNIAVKKSGTEYWRVTHNGDRHDRCYLGSEPGEVDVLEEKAVKKSF